MRPQWAQSMRYSASHHCWTDEVRTSTEIRTTRNALDTGRLVFLVSATMMDHPLMSSLRRSDSTRAITDNLIFNSKLYVSDDVQVPARLCVSHYVTIPTPRPADHIRFGRIQSIQHIIRHIDVDYLNTDDFLSISI